jgi:hypothetical protein
MTAIDVDAQRRHITGVSRAARGLLIVTILLVLLSRWLPFWWGEDGVLRFTLGEALRIRWAAGDSPWPAFGDLLVKAGFTPWLWLELPQTLFLVAGSWQLVRVFRYFERGEIFSEAVVGCFRRLGGILLGWSLVLAVYPLVVSLATLALGWNRAGIFWFESGWSTLLYVVAGLLLLAIASVLRAGLQLHREQALTI